MPSFRSLLPPAVCLTLASFAAGAHGQYLKTHGATLSVGASGQFDHVLESDPRYTAYTFTSGGRTVNTQTFQQNQFTKDKVGFVSTFMFNPKPWAGLAINYGFNHNEERYQYRLATNSSTATATIPTDAHEFTGGYLFHARHIPFQPYVEVGGGAIGFMPWTGSTQWRGAGLLETGFDLPVKSEHIGFRVAGRSLYYRSPNFGQSYLSSRAWRVSIEPTVSAFYRF